MVSGGWTPLNKLVSLTWLLWALRSFRTFTLHFEISESCQLSSRLGNKYSTVRYE